MQIESLEERRVLATLYVDNFADFVVTTDQGAPGLDNGDTVTWDPGAGSQHGAAVAGLTFGTSAFSTIQSAVNTAVDGVDVIRVAGGTFSELVTINKTVDLLGNQVGVDAQTRAAVPETIVNGNAGTTSLWVQDDDVEINGFTIRDQTNVNQFGAGVFMNPGTAGLEFRNNIVEFNVVGLFLANDVGGNQTVIERNIFRQNNQPGAASGTGIYLDQFTAGATVDNVLIANNTFQDNDSAGINLSSTDPTKPATNITISQNNFDNNGSGVVLFTTTNSTVTQNNFTGSDGSQIYLGGGNNNVAITENFIENGDARGIRIQDAIGGAPNQGIAITNNSIENNVGAGLEVDAGAHTGPLNAENNWWGSATGPTSPNNPGGTGQVLDDPSGVVDFSPFLATDVDTQPGTPGFQGNLAVIGITVIGTADDDVVIVTATSENDGSYQVITNGVPGPIVPFMDITSFSADLLGDNDRLVIDNTLSGGLFAPINGIFYDGGGQPGDALENLGGTATSGVYNPGPTNDAGVIIHTGAAFTQTISFTGLAPAIDTVAELDFTINGTAAANVISITNGAPGQITVAVDAFEPLSFANKTNVDINALGGADRIRLNATVPATGLATLEIFGQGGGVDDNANDLVRVDATLAGVATSILGQGGSDLVHNQTDAFGPGTLSLTNFAGPLTITGGETAADNDVVMLTNPAGVGTASTLTANQLVGAAPAPISYVEVEGFVYGGATGSDTLDVLATALGTSYYLTGNGGSDTITVGNQSADFGGVFDGDLSAIQGNVLLAGDWDVAVGSDSVNIDASGMAALAGPATISLVAGVSFNAGPFFINPTGDATVFTNFAPATIAYHHGAISNIGSVAGSNRVELLNVLGSTGDDTIAVNATTATNTTTIDTRQGNDVVTIAGDNLSASNVFSGFDGTDTTTLNIAAHLGNTPFVPLTALAIHGNDPASDSENRDRLNINDSNAAFIRNLNFDYLDTAGDMNVLPGALGQGLGGPAVPNLAVSVRTMETIVTTSAAADDALTVTGTSADDILTAFPGPAGTALVFLGGNPYLDAPPVSVAGFLPGLAGGGQGPDLFLGGAASVTLDGGAAAGEGNRAVVQATSEAALITGGTLDIFGFGAGVLVPGAGVGNAYDTINVTDSLVTVSNNLLGAFTPIGLATGTFNQTSTDTPFQRPGLIVNGGDEAVAQANGISDNITATVSGVFNIQVNGNLPELVLGPDGLPIGDQLNLVGPGDINIFSDKTVPPTVTVTFSGIATPFGVQNTSIERLSLDAGAPSGTGRVNLIGDNNDPALDQNDNFVVRGRDVDGNLLDAGYQEMTVVINGSAPILLNNVQRLVVTGDDAALTPSAGPNDIDTLDIRAYADNAGNPPNNAPRGWGVDVFFNEGNPPGADGNQADLIIYHTSAGLGGGGSVSEDVVVQPSGPDNGEIRATNATDGSVIVTIQYVANTDIVVLDDDGALADTDTLTLNGTNPDGPQTSGRETFAADFTAAGDLANPLVTVTDTATTAILYRLRNFVGFSSITLNPLGGGDTINLTNRAGLTVNANGGDPTSIGTLNDALNVTVTGNARYTQASLATQGRIDETLAGDVNFTGFETLSVNSPLGDGLGVFTVRGTDDNDTITLDRLGTNDLIWINDGPVISFTGFDSAVTLQGRFGDDKFSVAPIGVLTSTINVVGGDPTTDGDEIIIAGDTAANVFTYTPTAADAATLATVGSPTIGIATIEKVSINGLGGGDSLTINGNAGDETVVTNPTGGGSGTLRSGTSPITDFVSYLALVINGGGGFDQVEITGTNGIDTVTSDNDTVFFAGAGNVTMDGGVERMLLSTLGGNDNINLDLTSAALAKTIDAGAGNDIVDLFNSVDADIFGGIGDDTLIGSPAADNIFGGAGNDILIGGLGIDHEYGEDGNDRFGDLLLAGNGVNDDPGADFMFGGDGIDQFIWEPGDGSDVIQGGVDGGDILRFFGDVNPNAFVVTPAPGAPTHLNTILGGATVDTHGVEQLIVSGLAGADSFTLADLTPTEVESIILVVDAAAGAADTVTVNGRTVSDNVNITVNANGPGGTPRVNIAGLDYDVDIDGIALADADTLTFNGNEGNDTILVDNDPNPLDLAALFTADEVIVNAGLGDDFVSGFGTLNGNEGNDTLVGGSVAQTIDGGAGDDTIRGGGGIDVLVGDAGEDTFLHDLDGAIDVYHGGTAAGIDTEFDTILFRGGSSDDTMSANQTLPGTLVTSRGAIVETDTLGLTAASARSIDRVRLEGQSGDDIFFLTHLDALGVNGLTPDAVVFDVDGGAHFTRDRLSVQDNGTGDLLLYRKGELDSTGSITVGPGNPEGLENYFSGVEFIQPIAGAGGQVLVFKHDPNESNEDRVNATHLGAGHTINVDPTIDPGPLAVVPGGFVPLPGDQDFYRLTPATNGTLDIQVYFNEFPTVLSGRPGLPNAGNLNIEVQDADGTVIAGFGPNFGTNDGLAEFNVDGEPNFEDERIRIPAVAGQTYYVRVFGVGAAINNYTMTIVNEAVATPIDLELDDRIVVAGVQAGGNSTTSINSDLDGQFPDGFFNGKVVSFNFATPTTPGIAGEEALVTGYVGLTGVFTLSPTTPLSAAPAALDTFQVESVDTGRHNNDNITRDNTPTIFLRLPNIVNILGVAMLDDLPNNGQAPGNPPDEFIGIPFVPDLTLDATLPGFRVPVFVTERGTSDQGPPNSVLAGYAQPVDPVNRPGVFSFTFGSLGSFITSLTPDGSYFISARVEMIDPASPQQAQGYGALAQSLEIFVDTTPPPVAFGDPGVDGDGLTPDSDSFVIPNPETIIDLVTTDLTPTFWGRAEADATIRLFADAFVDLNANGVFDFVDVNGNDVFDAGDIAIDTPPNGVFDPNTDLFIGQTTAIPLDGNQQEPGGFWQIESVFNFNDPRFFIGLGGTRTVFVTAEDVAGNVNDNVAPQELDIFIDVQGPQITDVTVNGPSGSIDDVYNLFDPKPSTDGPTPLVNSIFIEIQDLPLRDLPLFDSPAFKPDIAANPGHYLLTGDYNGIIPILGVNVILDPVLDGQEATGRVELVFRLPGDPAIPVGLPGNDGVFNTSDDIGAALPDDRFTLFVNDDGIVDFAGNNLDGESNADEPHNSPPGSGQPDVLGVDGVSTGDGVPGGDFLARFTVDTRPELGVWANGSAFLDINGNTIWDPDNADFTNRDITHMLGYVSDDLFAGQFARNIGGVLTNDGFDKLAAYGRVGNTNFRWLIDTDNDGVADIERVDPANINGLPVAGNFDLTRAGDEVGLFTGTTWHFDTDQNYRVDTSLPWPVAGHPIVGDFDGDGRDDLGTWTNDVFSFDLSSINSAAGGLPGNAGIDGTVERTFKFGFAGPGERPVAADMNQDGIEDVGLWMPAGDGIEPRGQAEWYFLISGVTQNDTHPKLPANLGPTITGSNNPAPGSYDADPTLYGLNNYTKGRIVVDPLSPSQNVVRFQPVPFGNDQHYQFGDDFALPIVGNFDPPVTTPSTNTSPGTNPRNQHDVTNDGKVNQLDLLAIINHLTVNGAGPAPTGFATGPFVDANQDSTVNALDLLAVINYLTQHPISLQNGGAGEGEGSDEFFSQLGSSSDQDDDDELLGLLASGN